jgi:hypothetical protein
MEPYLPTFDALPPPNPGIRAGRVVPSEFLSHTDMVCVGLVDNVKIGTEADPTCTHLSDC